jgi:hypothetical protein
MKKIEWFDRQFNFGQPAGMLPFHLERLKGTIARIEQKVAGVDEAVLSNKWNGKWSIKENIAHLAEVDEIATRRIDEIVQGISPFSPAVVQPGRDYNAMPVAEIVKLFRTNRTKNLERFRQLADHEFGKSSLHPRLKVTMTPVDLALFDAEHDDHHLVRVDEILEGLRK